MLFLVLQAYLNLIHFDLYMARRNFAVLYNKVRTYPVAKGSPTPDAIEKICYAVDLACIWYWKEALCLQRSAADMSSQTIRCTCAHGDRRAAHTLQVACMG